MLVVNGWTAQPAGTAIDIEGHRRGSFCRRLDTDQALAYAAAKKPLAGLPRDNSELWHAPVNFLSPLSPSFDSGVCLKGCSLETDPPVVWKISKWSSAQWAVFLYAVSFTRKNVSDALGLC
jgi:hypothetical protein